MILDKNVALLRALRRARSSGQIMPSFVHARSEIIA
jgi:hypothetical protein